MDFLRCFAMCELSIYLIMGKVDFLAWRMYALHRVPSQLIHVIAFINISRYISNNIVHT